MDLLFPSLQLQSKLRSTILITRRRECKKNWPKRAREMEESKKNAELQAMEFLTLIGEMRHQPFTLKLASQYIGHPEEGRIDFLR